MKKLLRDHFLKNLGPVFDGRETGETNKDQGAMTGIHITLSLKVKVINHGLIFFFHLEGNKDLITKYRRDKKYKPPT